MNLWAYVGDFYHRGELARAALQGAFAEGLGAGSVQLRLADTPEQFVEGLAGRPDAAVLFAENRLDPENDAEKLWMNEQHAAAIVQYVEEGGGWLAWHSGLASYPPDGLYTALLKGYFVSHPAEHQLVRYEPAGSSRLALETMELLDEHYFVACRENETEVFLSSSSVDGSSVAGWRHRAGAGRVCCLTPAHRKEGLSDSRFLGLLRASICWTAGDAIL
ncbi:ThuA domain-containing protein [Paenibacillus sp. PL2-23]|uniref:ThuA domain-containing protein n=1 Tax=Paenibacillus sp. PL2-23 TaxID=2100729 RepID=UPI0030F821EE